VASLDFRCEFCGEQVPDERVYAGYSWCLGESCVRAGLRRRRFDWRTVLVPKSGFTVMRVDDAREQQSGRSSGR